MSDIAISVQNVSKRYHVYESQRARIKHAFWPSKSDGLNEIWALQDISFEVKRGESVAIIGRNGSGKSTLLEIITQTLAPTSGSVQIHGRVAALLELGSGFKPDYTGRENVFLNGLLLGLSRAEVERRFEDIVAFADIGDVLDRPVKTYSSGMVVRLAFAVQVALDPDILIVDEALSVGDYFFQQKCFGRLRQMRENGLTLLFVSHDMGTVRDLCSDALYLKQGTAAFFGVTSQAIRAYLAQGAQQVAAQEQAANTPAGASVSFTTSSLEAAMQIAMWRRGNDANAALMSEGRILAVVLNSADDQPFTSVKMGQKLRLQVYFRTHKDESGHISLAIKNKYDQVVSNVSSWAMNQSPMESNTFPYIIFELEVDCMLEAGLYSLMISFGLPLAVNSGESRDSTGWFGPLQIDWNYENERAPFLGMFGIPAKGKVVQHSTPILLKEKS
jgi:lipopolysaccharide transport system ATP-binding protein